MAKPEKRNSQDDNNSENELIDLLKTILTGMFSEVHDALHSFQSSLTAKETKDQERHLAIMTALETLTASVTAGATAQTALTTAVNAAIVRLGSPGATDAQLLTLAAAIDGLNASDVSLKNALQAALDAVQPNPGSPVIVRS